VCREGRLEEDCLAELVCVCLACGPFSLANDVVVLCCGCVESGEGVGEAFN
jgi:hypothetical protein